MRFVLPAVCLAAFNQLSKLFSASQPSAELFRPALSLLGFRFRSTHACQCLSAAFSEYQGRGGLASLFVTFLKDVCNPLQTRQF